MPVYSYCCANGHRFDRYLPLARYAEPQTCECGADSKKSIYPVAIRGDLPGYESPTTGKWVEGRTARRDDLARSGCRPWEGLEQETKESARQRAYAEQKADAALERAIGETYAAMS